MTESEEPAIEPEETEPGRERAALSRELSEFLIELSIGVHRYVMYPAGHPSLESMAERVLSSLQPLFQNSDKLTIGVGHEELLVEGVATDSRHPVLSELARRLHGHQFAAVIIEATPLPYEIEGLLATVSQESERSGRHLGLLPSNEIPDWDHIHLFGIGYDRLRLDVEGEAMATSRALELWHGLATAALSVEEDFDPEDALDPGRVASTIQRQQDASYDQVVVEYLLQLASELKEDDVAESAEVRQRISSLITELDDDALARLVKMGGNSGKREQFVMDASKSFTADAVMKVLSAAASASEQTISTSLTRLLTKLAAHAESGVGTVSHNADSALRDNVEELIENWELGDPNPEGYTLVLDRMSAAAPVFMAEEVAQEEDSVSGARRLLEMSVEVDTYGPLVDRAVAELMSNGKVRHVLGMLDDAVENGAVAKALHAHVTNPNQIRRLLSLTDVETDELRALTARIGPNAIEPLLEVLAESDSRHIRRKVIEVLSELGPAVGQRAMGRLQDSRWFVIRNLLVLFRKLEIMPEGLDVHALANHSDPRVRREAFPIAVNQPALRDRTLAGALADADERIVYLALQHLRSGVPETLVPTIVKRVIHGDRSSELRALGARTLGPSESPLALDALIELTTDGKTILRRHRIAQGDPEVLAALSMLAAHWPGDPRAKSVLAEARRSRRREIRTAVAGEGEKS
ncbi:MAG: hypothetical protein BMS9Abin29_0106 [Gemmatimonadota bacterium]|nr:MAG: hypothetical protein BMS9Abin29_0106 [Gemmatimonadota bacterium]